MSLSTTAIVDANGTATSVIKNDSPVMGFRIDALTIRVESDPLPGQCTVYRGSIGATIIAQSGLGRFDQANGPYWLGPGAEITLQWAGQTPGLLAYADVTGIQVPNQDTFQQGVLRFENPPSADIGPGIFLSGTPFTIYGQLFGTGTVTATIATVGISEYAVINACSIEYGTLGPNPTCTQLGYWYREGQGGNIMPITRKFNPIPNESITLDTTLPFIMFKPFVTPAFSDSFFIRAEGVNNHVFMQYVATGYTGKLS